VPDPPAERPATPERPLAGGAVWSWATDFPLVRIYHADARTPEPERPRQFGPVARFDPHQVEPPALDPEGRTALYVAAAIETSVCETIGRRPGLFEVCPQWRLAFLCPVGVAVALQDLVARSASELGAPDDLGDGPWAKADTQRWARAIYDDRPAGHAVAGIRYWSRRHRRQAEGTRAGMNSVVWDTAPALQRVPGGTSPEAATGQVALHRIWPRVLDALSGTAATAAQIVRADCGKCRDQGLREPGPAGSATA
jgi:hypothetical protein